VFDASRDEKEKGRRESQLIFDRKAFDRFPYNSLMPPSLFFSFEGRHVSQTFSLIFLIHKVFPHDLLLLLQIMMMMVERKTGESPSSTPDDPSSSDSQEETEMMSIRC
jgi:hypothetical protein